ncbi:MAG TPA: transglycosylase SLT domain-containing protein [Alphaproteobacteria bacterium]|nr:transglycosylase SLT domain-containing protein [Alphaproteobacteria bacterium]
MNPLGSLAGRLATEGVNYAPEIVGAAQKYGLDPTLLAALAAQETGGPGANGGRNEVGDGGHGHGLFQIDDRWHDFARTAAAMDPARNADYAAGMLSGLLKRYGGNVREALSAYNAGSPTAPGTATTWGDGQTLDYADSVLRHCRQLGAGGDGVDRLAQTAQTMPQPIPAAGVPRAHHHHHRWRSAEGLDPTGHSSNASMSYDTYINGDTNQ